MMRYMICPIVGDGSSEDSFRASVGDIDNTNISAVIPTYTSGPLVGRPKYSFAFCAVSSRSWPGVAQISNSFLLPEHSLDSRMDGMEAATRNAFRQNVEAYNLDGAGFHLDADNNDAESYRMVLDRIVRQFDPGIGINNVTIGEVPA